MGEVSPDRDRQRPSILATGSDGGPVSQMALALRGDDALGARFIQILGAVVERIGLKQAAYDLDVQPSHLAHAIAGRNHNHLRAEWVPWIVRHDVSGEALRYLADLTGHDLVPQRALEPAEELAALKAALDKCLGAPVKEAIEVETRRIAARNR